MKTKSMVLLVCAVLALGSAAVAFAGEDRPHEGRIVSIDTAAMTMVIQGEKDDQWTLNWTESTKLKGDVTVPELKVGDKVHFDYTKKDDLMWLTELKRTDKAKS